MTRARHLVARRVSQRRSARLPLSRARPRVGIVPTRPPETAPRRAQRTANRIRDGGAFSPDWLDRRGVKCSFSACFFFRGDKRKRDVVVAHLSLLSLSCSKLPTGPNHRGCPQEEAFGEDQQPFDRGCVSGGYPEEARGEVGCPRRRARRRASRDQGAPAQGEGCQEGQEVKWKRFFDVSFGFFSFGFFF